MKGFKKIIGLSLCVVTLGWLVAGCVSQELETPKSAKAACCMAGTKHCYGNPCEGSQMSDKKSATSKDCTKYSKRKGCGQSCKTKGKSSCSSCGTSGCAKKKASPDCKGCSMGDKKEKSSGCKGCQMGDKKGKSSGCKGCPKGDKKGCKEKVKFCTKCSFVKGSPECCKVEGKQRCSKCNLIKGSPDCCKIPKGDE